MEEMYLGWSKQLRDALEKWGEYKVSLPPRRVIVVGMGGSGIVGDYVGLLSSHMGGPQVATIKSHILPRNIGREDLVIAVSYSGNTHETLIAVKEALERGLSTVAVSSGGALMDLARKKGLLHIPLPTGLAPRASLASMLYSILGLLDASGASIVEKKVAAEAASFLESATSRAVKEAEDVANWIHREKGLLVLATHSPLEALVLRGKNEFNENSKIPVKIDVAPEWMHNDIVGYEKPDPPSFKVIGIYDPDDGIGKGLLEFMKRIYERINAPFLYLGLAGGNVLEKVLYGSLVMGLTSCKLARLRGINPLETPGIREYKRFADSLFSQLL